MNSQVEQVGKDLRRMMPWLNPKEVKPGEGGACEARLRLRLRVKARLKAE